MALRKITRVVVWPDTHVPNHDVKATKVVLKFLKYFKPHILILIGDLLDCEGVSFHKPSESQIPYLMNEFDEGNKLLDRIQATVGKNCKLVYCIGNHEERIERWIAFQNPSLSGVITIEKELHLKERGIEVIPMNKFYKVGKLHFTHGIYTGVHHSLKHVKATMKNTVYGHLHDLQLSTVMSASGPKMGICCGCLAKKNPAYMKNRPNNWMTGFGVFYVFENGEFTAYLPQIIKNRFVWDGKVFKA